MSRRAFLLRVDPDVLTALQRWADDDLRSLNGQIEYVLRRALRDAGRGIKDSSAAERDAPTGSRSTGAPSSKKSGK